MEANVQCSRCDRWLTLDEVNYSVDGDEPCCVDCLDEVLARAELLAKSAAEDRDVDAYEAQQNG